MNFQGILVILGSTQVLTSSLFSLSGLLNQTGNRDQPESVFQAIIIIYTHKWIDLFQGFKQLPNCVHHAIRFLNRWPTS